MRVRLLLAGLLSACTARAADPQFDAMELKGWTRDGASVARTGTMSGGYGEMGGPGARYTLLLVADADGRTRSTFRWERDVDEGQAIPEAEALWNRAEPEEKGESWLKANALVAAPASRRFEDTVELGGQPPLVARADLAKGSGCRPAHLVVAGMPFLDDVCGKNEEATRDVRYGLQVAWSPDGSRAALAWTVVRVNPDEGPAVERAHFAVVSRRAFASVDLLDAGAGSTFATLAARIEKAGFRIGHKGKAQAQRPTTLIYFAPGFEKEAREVAQIAGAAPESVQPLSWKSPHAITVAAGPAPAAGR
jgi:hypothetical protein